MINFRLGGIAAAAGFVLSLAIGLVSGARLDALFRALVIAAFFFVLVNLLLLAAGRFLPELLEISRTGKVAEPAASGSRVNISLDGDVSAGAWTAGKQEDSPDGGFDPSAPIPGAALDQFGEDEYTLVEPGSKGASGVLDLPLAGGTPAGGGKDSGGPVGDASGGGAAGPAPLAGALPSGAAAGGMVSGQSGGSPVRGASAVALPKGDGAVDILPDLEAMSEAFLASTREAETGGADLFDGGGARNTASDVFDVSVSGKSRAPARSTGAGNAVLEGDFQPKDIAQAIQTLLRRDQ